MWRSLFASLCLVLPLSAHAINNARCDDDGVTTVPPFAIARDANQCLRVSPGNGDPEVLFQYDFFDKTGDQQSIVSGSVGFNDNCPDEGSSVGCTYMIWRSTLDNYNRQAMANEDIWKTSIRAEYLYIKDTLFINGWKCDGSAWSGPGGISCSSTESKAHSDGIQMRRNPVNGGWVIFQDSALSNAFNATCRFTDGPLFGAAGSFLFQGFQLGQFTTPLGLSTNYVDECKDRGGNASICETNSCIISAGAGNLNEMWIIDTWGSTPISLQSDHHKTIIINTGCNQSGCNGTVGMVNGWPWPLGDTVSAGPGGVAPNGLVTQNPMKTGFSSDAVFWYSSIEAARDDVAGGSGAGSCPTAFCPHKLPPFIQHSDTGWASAPGGGPGLFMTLSSAPVSPLVWNTGFTLTAVPSGGTAPYVSVAFDCDGDLAFDDGTDVLTPFTMACAGFSTSGTKTVGARVTDTPLATFDQTLVLTVLPQCGNNVREGAEVCDGTDLASQTCVTQGYASGTLSCHANCGSLVLTSCTGAPTCGNGVCSASETEVACFADCALFDVAVIADDQFTAWDYYLDPISESGSVVDYGVLVQSKLTFVANPPAGSLISGFRFIMDGDTGSVYSVRQNSAAYALCGDEGETVEQIFACDGASHPSIPYTSPPAILKGSHSLAVTPCSANWSPGITDVSCTNGGTLGPTKTINFTLIHKQVVRLGLHNALLQFARRAVGRL